MKNVIKLFGIIALTAVIVFTTAGCGGDDDTKDNSPKKATYTSTANGTTYILVITGDEAQALKAGAAYVLTAGSKESKGTVLTVTNGVLTLKPNAEEGTTFTATVSDSGLTAMNGTIKWTDNTEDTAPGELTPVNPNPPNPGTGGTFTLTGIPEEFNGKYAYATINNSPSQNLFGSESIVISPSGSEITFTLSRISNGSVSIPLWKLEYTVVNGSLNTSVVRYTGNDTFSYSPTFAMAICTVQTTSTTTLSHDIIGRFALSGDITFSNGSATRTWADGSYAR